MFMASFDVHEQSRFTSADNLAEKAFCSRVEDPASDLAEGSSRCQVHSIHVHH